MADAEEQYRKEAAEAGVDLPELTEEEAGKEPKAPAEDAPKEPLQDQPIEQRKRSIYDDLKDKKSELKSEKELREQAEQERDELKQKLEALGTAGTAKEREEAQDELDTFLASHKEWDKNALKDLIAIARKGVAPELPESITKDLEEFKVWKAQNSQFMEQSKFEEEFQATVPALKELFPAVSDDELKAIRKELDTLSHKQEWHDKSLDYIAFKHKGTLQALVSPKKRGLEGKGRIDVEAGSFEFDPDADLTKLSPAEYAEWEKQYQQATKSDGLLTDAKGKKTLL